MKCPLTTVISTVRKSPKAKDWGDCIQEECAWWDDGSSACAIWSLMSELDALGKVLREIEQKTPLGRVNSSS